MPNTSAEWWSWTPGRTQGLGQEISLAQDWLNIGTIGGSRFGLPLLRGNDYEIPFRSGTQWRAKYPNSRTVTLIMWTAGIDQFTGNPADDPIAQWNLNWQKIRQVLWNRGAQGSLQGRLTRRWNVSYQGAPQQVVTAHAMAEIAGSPDPSMTGRARNDMTVDLLLSDPYFYDDVSRTETLAYNVARNITADGEGVVGEGWPSLVNSFTVTLHGPLTTPTVANATEGVSFTYGGTIASGHYVTLDILRKTAVTDLGINVVSAISHYGARMWMALSGGENPFNTLTLSSVSGADTGTAVLAWNDCYV